MKQKDIAITRSLTKEELIKRIAETEKSLAGIVRDRYTKQSKNTREGKNMRISLAQMKTILREKELVA